MRQHFAGKTLRVEKLGQDAAQASEDRSGRGAHLPCALSLQASSVLSRIFPRAFFDMFLKKEMRQGWTGHGCSVFKQWVGRGGPYRLLCGSLGAGRVCSHPPPPAQAPVPGMTALPRLLVGTASCRTHVIQDHVLTDRCPCA